MQATTVLVVDDSELIRRHVRVTLEAAGFDVIEAKSANEALAKLESAAHVGLAICDINMPEVGGLAFLESLRKDGPWSKLPVLFLTAEADPKLIDRARALAAAGWVVKPFEPKRLVETTKRLTAA